LKFQNGIRRMENPARLAQIRKDIARVKTIIKETTAE
jgi:large subunit ribosomal protein L29